MEIKWQYHQQFEQWRSSNWIIEKDQFDQYVLCFDSNDEDCTIPKRWIGDFKKLSSAKQVAALIEEDQQ